MSENDRDGNSISPGTAGPDRVAPMSGETCPHCGTTGLPPKACPDCGGTADLDGYCDACAQAAVKAHEAKTGMTVLEEFQHRISARRKPVAEEVPRLLAPSDCGCAEINARNKGAMSVACAKCVPPIKSAPVGVCCDHEVKALKADLVNALREGRAWQIKATLYHDDVARLRSLLVEARDALVKRQWSGRDYDGQPECEEYGCCAFPGVEHGVKCSLAALLQRIGRGIGP